MAGAQAAWGIDVGVSSLKAMKLRKDGDRVTIEAFEVIEHDKFLSEPDVDRDSLIRSTLQKFVSKYPVRRDVVFIGVPGSTSFARFVKLPPVETKKIPEIVRFEAIQQIPFPLEQVNWDYHTFQHPDSPDVEVGIFAMKKELVAHVMSNFRSVDMNVQGVQMSPLAVYNAAAYEGMTKDKGTVVIDMGAEHTDLVIMDQGRLWLRSINIGGNHFTDALAKSFKQQFSKAESLKKTAATSKYQKQIYQAMRPIFADLVSEIQRSLGAYNSTHRDSRLEHIICMGNPFKLPNLQKYLQQELKMDVERLETYKQANVEKAAAFTENILSMSAAYGLAVQALGLAAIDTNLLPIEIARAMMWKKKQPWFIAATAVVALGAVGLTARWWGARSSFNSEANQTLMGQNESVEAGFNKQVKEWQAINSDYKTAQNQVEGQFRLLAARKIWPSIMADVLSALPQAKGGSADSIVLTDVTSEYSSDLSSVKTDASGGTAGAGGSGAAPVIPQPGATPAAATQPGATDHGFLLTISGYARVANPKNGYTVVANYQKVLVGKSGEPDLTKNPNPYYYEGTSAQYSGHPVPPAAGAASGGGAFGGGFAGGGGGAAAGSQAGDKPWGNVKGPFWEVFFADITGYRPAAPTAAMPGMMPTGNDAAQFDLPYAIDLVATRATSPASPKPMTSPGNGPGAYAFALRVKVFIKGEPPKTP